MIKFYKTGEDFGEFSNFYKAKIFIDGKWWASTEHYYQAMKTTNIDEQDLIRSFPSCFLARLAGQKVTLREDFDQVKDSIMMRALEAKFTQHKDLQDILLNTNDEELVEDSPVDFYWGCGKDGSGQNKLGKLLIELRNQLRNQ